MAPANSSLVRSLLLSLACSLVMSACSRGTMAPVVDLSSSASASGQSAANSGARRASAGSETATSDWTAKVRPLGDTGSTPSRELPSETSAPAPTQAAALTSSPAVAPAAPPVGRSTAPAPTAASPAAVNPAVVSLLNTASAQSQAGDHARAAATLERAIAIEPNNAWLWYRLADTRANEGRLDQAAGLAAKSNALATADRSLQAENWKLIAKVRRRQGDVGGAAAAESRAAALAN